MNIRAESDAAVDQPPTLPVFTECDRLGCILWQSARANSVLGARAGLADALTAGAARWTVTCLLDLPQRVWLGLQPLPKPETAAHPAAFALRHLEGRLLGHYFHLQQAERNIADRVKRGRGRAGAGQLIQHVERERQRLGRELHTGVGQLLAAIGLQLDTIATAIPDPPPAAQQALDRISLLAGDALEQVRAVSRRLHPPVWQRLTLEDALRQMWASSGVPEKFAATATIPSLSRDPEPEIKALLYRAAQEAISNLVRHSRATAARLSLTESEDRLHLTVWDNGGGFDVDSIWDAPADIGAGLGLRSLREEAAAAGATLRVESGPSGTSLMAAAPFEPKEPE
ncbi:MAG: sensor histidine kinase [Bryobacteraceae bacterium]